MIEVRKSRELAVVLAASSAGAYGPGQELAPAAFIRHGLVARLQSVGGRVVERGTVVASVFQQRGDPRANNVEQVVAAARAVAGSVAESLESGQDVLVLGGDCTVEVGTVAGAVRDGSRVCSVYIDLDADLNTPDTGDGILDWMGVAHLLDVPGADRALAGVGTVRPLVGPDAVLLMAVDRATDAESELIERLGLRRETLQQVQADAAAVLERTAAWAAGFDRLLVHVDADVLDFAAFPIAENTRRVPGLQLETLAEILRGLCRLPNWRCLTVTEVNPAHADDEVTAFTRLVQVLSGALGDDTKAGTSS